jgi:hypothetical protein
VAFIFQNSLPLLPSVPPVLEHFMGQTLPRGNGAIDALIQKHPRIKHLEGLFSDGAANE